MNALAQSIILAWGWRRAAIAFLAGATGTLALPPFDFFPALAVPMTVAVWLLDGAGRVTVQDGKTSSIWRSLLDVGRIGWFMGFGYFLAGLWWLGSAFLVEADQFAWALPLGVVGLPAGLAFFTAIGFVFSWLLWSTGWARILALAAGLTLSEWLRATILTGFPWNEFGMALGGNLVLAQIASVVGLHGLTVLSVAIFAAPALLADVAGQAGWLRRVAPVAVACLMLAALAAFGTLRLSGADAGNVAGVRLRIMQPNLPQDAKFRPDRKNEILDRYLRLSDRATSPQITGVGDVTHLIWPESAFPFILSRDAQALAEIGRTLGSKTILLTGAARVAEPAPGEKRMRYFNSIHAIGSGGVILDTSDKAHLVPFGEYLPLGALLDKTGLRQFVHIPGGFDASPRRKGMTIPGLPFVAPLICYEAIFPGDVLPEGGTGGRPGLLLNVTNDGWFGMTPGPYQHLAQARLRSIEEGLPLVRAANTGISAIVDPLGRYRARLGLGIEGVLDGALPKPLPPTLFATYPLIIPALLWAVALIGALVLRRRQRYPGQKSGN